MKSNLAYLELKVPPLALLGFFGTLMWIFAQWCPGVTLHFPFQGQLALVLMALGLFIILAGVQAFKVAQTTVNPLQPSTSSHLVTNGVYQHTRNPMYVGMALIVAAWFVALGNILNLAFLSAFVVCIHNLQILPEERILKEGFGKEYLEYMERVPRWL